MITDENDYGVSCLQKTGAECILSLSLENWRWAGLIVGSVSNLTLEKHSKSIREIAIVINIKKEATVSLSLHSEADCY